MVLLDSLIAFALTLAALATIVTIFMEIITRVAGLKARRQVQLFGKLFDEVLVTHLPAEAKKWEVVKTILQSRLSDKKMADSADKQSYFGTAAGAIYDDVSLEHVLRRLLETSGAETLIEETEEKLKTRLGLIARKYEEYCSALGADFKRNALRRSIWIGIILAFIMNADGVRLLTSYLQDPELRERVIENLEVPPQPAEAVSEGTEEGEAVLRRTQDARDQLALIDDLALPIGAGYFPYCHIGWLRDKVDYAADPLCQAGADTVPSGSWLLWLLKVLGTGILIGLGAPFWYDVAKRLSEVREAFKGKGTAEAAHRGADAGGDVGARETLVEQIVDDVKEAVRAGLWTRS